MTSAPVGKGDGSLRRLPLARSAQSPHLARTWVRERLHEWDLPHLNNNCLLVTSELVTNAVIHGSEPIRVCLALRSADLTLEVTDGQHELEQAPAPDDCREGGRGLALVRAFTDRFQFQQHPGNGKSAIATWHR